MPTCQYFGQTDCTAPTFGGDSAPVVAGQHENFIEHYLMLGNSPIEWVINGFIWLLIIRFVLWPFLITPLLDWLDFRRQQKIETVSFELTPHHTTSVPANAMTELFKILHAQYSRQTHEEYWLRRKKLITCELVSTRDGTRYVVRVPKDKIELFQHAVTALQHEIRFEEVEDYLKTASNKFTAAEAFRQLRSFAYPLRRHTELETHDPMTYLTSALAKPKPGETLALQMVLTPYKSPRRAARIRNKLLEGKNPWLMEFNSALPINLFLLLCRWTVKALLFMFNIGVFIINIFTGRFTLPQSGGDAGAEATVVTPAAQTVRDNMIDKLGEPLFYADIRAYVSARKQQDIDMRLSSIAGAMSTFDEPGYQSITTSKNLLPSLVLKLVDIIVPATVWQKLQDSLLRKFRRRLPSTFTFNSNVLSTSEIATLYHFPYEQAVTTEGVVRSMSRTLPAPNAIKRNADKDAFDIVLGENIYHGASTNIGLIADERERHVYIIGGTGNGKTTMLEYGIVQDIRNGKGVAVIDPHGDSAKKLLQYIPEDRIKDVIYFNPRDYDYPLGLNLLELPEGLTGSALAHEKDLVTEAVISVLSKIFDDNTDSNAYRIERILRNTIHTAFTVEGATLFTVLRLLTEASYRKKVTRNLKDERLKRFWKEELGKAGEMQRVKISGGPITRIERFEASESAQRVLGQAKSTINFEDIMNSGKILICNFSKGGLGEDTSTLFGTTVLAKLQLAAWRREEMAEDERRPFYLYVDEFQNFASNSFMGFFSEARKYKLFVTIAQQSVSQLKEQSMLNTILDNVGTIVAFRSKSPATEELLLHQFKPYIEQGDILNLPTYNFYAKIAAKDSLEPLSGQTIVLPKGEASSDVASDAVSSSRKLYARKYVEKDKSAPGGVSADEGQAERNTDDRDQNPGDGELPGGVK
jgi:hypothetical protein